MNSAIDHFGKTGWQILCTACGDNAWYFNVANLHYEWSGGEQTSSARRSWYGSLRQAVARGHIKAYVDHWTPSEGNPMLMEVSFEEVATVDFRRRMYFRATRRGWAAYRKLIKNGLSRPVSDNRGGGYWVIEDKATGTTWKEDIRVRRFDT